MNEKDVKTSYSENELASLIGEVEEVFAKHLSEEEQKLEKSEEVVEEEVEETEELTKSEEVQEYQYDEEDLEEMNKLYAGMSKSEQEIHYKSLKKIFFGDMEKSEETLEKSEPKEEVVAKSEFDSIVEERDELKKTIESLTQAVKDFNKLRAPKQKAITQIQYLKKSEEKVEEDKTDYSKLSKGEINKILTAKIRSGEIKKSQDREAINAFCLDNTSIETIKHLL